MVQKQEFAPRIAFTQLLSAAARLRQRKGTHLSPFSERDYLVLEGHKRVVVVHWTVSMAFRDR